MLSLYRSFLNVGFDICYLSYWYPDPGTSVDPPQRQPTGLADDHLRIITVLLQHGSSLVPPSLGQSFRHPVIPLIPIQPIE